MSYLAGAWRLYADMPIRQRLIAVVTLWRIKRQYKKGR